jgi:hypothetical protein
MPILTEENSTKPCSKSISFWYGVAEVRLYIYPFCAIIRNCRIPIKLKDFGRKHGDRIPPRLDGVTPDIVLSKTESFESLERSRGETPEDKVFCWNT